MKLTAIFQASLEEVMQHASEHLVEPKFRRVGRLVAVQSPSLDEAGEAGLRSIAEARSLPLRTLKRMPAF